MKKKASLLIALSTLLAGGSLAAVVALGQNSYSLDPVKAAAKSFTFGESIGSQFDGGDSVNVVSVVTGSSSNLETSVSLLNGSDEQIKAFGDNGYFVRNGSTISHAKFVVSIGVNNPTSVSVTYGLVKPEESPHSNVTEVRCWIGAYADDTRLDETGISGDAGVGEDYTLTWTKQPGQAKPADEIRIETNTVDGSNISWMQPFYIKSIVLNWSC